MDADSKHAARALEALAASTEQLIVLKRNVQSYPGVTHVQHAVELRNYQTGPVLEAYVDAELATGNALAWWLEVHWGDAGWRIDYSIRLSDDRGEETIKAFPPRKATTLAAFVTQLEASIKDLTESIDVVRAAVA